MSSAAKTVSFSPLRRAQTSIKNTLDTPFKLKWPDVSAERASQILMEIEKALSDMKGSFARSKVSERKRARKHRKNKPSDKEQQEPPRKKQCIRTIEGDTDGDQDKSKPNTENTGEGNASELTTEERRQSGEDAETPTLTKKSFMVIGVNNVTRCLERGELCAGLVCLSARPALVTRHIMMLAATRCVPFVAIPDLSQKIVELLGDIKSALAIGFMKGGSCAEFSSLVKAITNLAPPIVIPWLSPLVEEHTLSTNDTAEALTAKQDKPSSSHCSSSKDVTVSEVATGEDKVSSEKGATGRQREVGEGVRESVTKVQAGSLYSPVQIKKTVVRSKKRKGQK